MNRNVILDERGNRNSCRCGSLISGRQKIKNYPVEIGAR
jgi:hypothetical protein